MKINNSLKIILEKVYNSSNYYQNIFDEILGLNYNFEQLTYEDFSKIPIMTRDNLMLNTSDILNKNITGVDLKDFIVTRTSGSVSGYPLEIYWSESDFIISNKYSWDFRSKMYNINPKDKYVQFHSFMYYKNKIKEMNDIEYYPNQNKLSLSSIDINEEKMKNYYEAICNFQPKWMFIAPHIALEFIEFLKNNKLELPRSIVYIETTGEPLLNSTKKLIKEFFKVNIANFYGSMETNGIAIECPYGHMHILEENVFIECVEGEILVTSLTNTQMPLIRYKLNDFIEIEKYDDDLLCECGYPMKNLSNIHGRSGTRFINNGIEITEKKIGYCIERVNSLYFDCIIQYQLIKNEESLDFTLYVENKYHTWNENIFKELKNQFHKLDIDINSWKVNIEYVNVKDFKYYKFKNLVIKS